MTRPPRLTSSASSHMTLDYCNTIKDCAARTECKRLDERRTADSPSAAHRIMSVVPGTGCDTLTAWRSIRRSSASSMARLINNPLLFYLIHFKISIATTKLDALL
ncbi:hypothetical protein J6590_069268, partial [Homalodisca vitripennis]